MNRALLRERQAHMASDEFTAQGSEGRAWLWVTSHMLMHRNQQSVVTSLLTTFLFTSPLSPSLDKTWGIGE